MWAVMTVIHPPGLDDGLRLDERGKLVHVQALITQAPIKRLKEAFSLVFQAE